MASEEEYKSILRRYLPLSAVDPIYDYIVANGIRFHIKRQRTSKLGDYRWPQRGHDYHEISINGDLNPYLFLMVFLHEAAHLETHLKYDAVAPHGHEWQANYARRINQYLGIFPGDVAVLLRHYTARIPLSRTIEKQINAQLRHYDPDYTPSQDITLNDLTPGTRFHIASRPEHHFQALEKRRTRWICLKLEDGKKYLVSGTAVVVTE